MKKLLALAVAALLLVPALALADGCEISAQGTATIFAEPDMVSISASAEVTCPTVAEAQTRISEIIAAATESLLALGIAEEDIVTENYAYYPMYDYQGDEPKLTGYQANHTLGITCRDVTLLDEALAAVTDSGMTQVYNVAYDVSNRSELYSQALALAVEAAGDKAAQMAKPLGLTRLTAESVTENGGYEYGVYANVTADRAKGAELSAASGIRSGNIQVSANVTVRYEAEK